MERYSDKTDADQLVLQDRIALRLGRMTMRIAAMESMTRFYLLQVLDIADDDEVRVEAIIGELSFRKLRAALLAAVRDSDRSQGPPRSHWSNGTRGRTKECTNSLGLALQRAAKCNAASQKKCQPLRKDKKRRRNVS
jgi:hypothetical protein